MKTFLMGTAALAILSGVGVANAQTIREERVAPPVTVAPPVVEQRVVPRGTVGMAPGTAADDASRSLYDASPTNGTSRFQQPPEGENGVKNNNYADPPRQPNGN